MDILEARLSADYFKRKEMMDKLEIPTLSDAKMHAGLPLSLVLFEECHPDLRESFGLTPYLQGARGELWTSPSDLLIGKVALKPPLTQKHVQALTHEGILDLGAQVEQKFLNEQRIEREKAVAEREDYLTRMYEAQKVELIKQVQKDEEEKYSHRINDMQEFYESQICQLLWECYDQVRQLQEQMQIEADSLNVLWQAKLEDEIAQTVARMNEEFLKKLARQEKVLVDGFRNRINYEKMTGKSALTLENRRCKEMVAQMKHQLHCENITNLMYLLCKERRKCKREKQEIEDNFKAQIRKHKQNINKKSSAMATLRRVKKEKTKQVNVRERCLTEILRQYQKFIYFALKAAPTQGEYLLNISKLIRFELDDYCLSKQEPKMRMKEEPGVGASPEPDADMNEILSARSDPMDEGPGPSDALPAFYFNDKLYVREDFRDMIEAGMEIGEKSSLWNPDVEELIKLFRDTIDKRNCQLGNVKSHHSSVHFSVSQDSSDSRKVSDAAEIVLPPKPTSSQEEKELLKMPNVPSMNRSSSEDEKEIRKVSLTDHRSVSRTRKQPSSPTSGPSRASRAEHAEDSDVRSGSGSPENALVKRTSRLAVARDSIILTLSTVERRSLQNLACKAVEDSASKSSGERYKVIKSANEEVSAGSSQMTPIAEEARSSKSLDEPFGTTSKLLLATDSYELIKSTIALVHGEDEQKQDVRTTSQLTSSPKVGSEGRLPHAKVAMKQNTKRPPKQKRKVAKPTRNAPKAKVVGSSQRREHEEKIDEFTNERIASLVNIMKENPSLIRLFTPCLQ